MSESQGGQPVAPADGGPRRGLRIALFLSLALNLLFVGLIVGAAAGGHPVRRIGMVADVGFGPMSGALTREDRRALRAAFEAEASGLHETRAAIRDDFRALAAVLKAPAWDGAAAEAILARQAARGAERMELGRRVFLAYLAGLTAEARAALAERIGRAMR
jgi:Spy/CpxP family protein refolding chaperone